MSEQEQKRHTADFESCIQHVMAQGHDKGSAFAICTKSFQDAGKPIFEGESKESFSWAGNLNILKPYGKLIRGEAIHPTKTEHPDEWPSLRVYLEEELQNSAETLIGKPLFLDHVRPLKGSVLGAYYENGALEYIADLKDEDVLADIQAGKIKHASVQFEWKTLENVNGLAPRGINFEHLSLLKNVEPGDPASTVQLWESIIKRLKEARQKDTTTMLGVVVVKKEQVSSKPVGVQASPTPPRVEGGKENMSKVLKERVWDRAYINDLPDEAFALIQKGGTKDETGRTVPRSLRRLPHHKPDGSIDLPHLRNALARAPQMKDVSEPERNEAIAHLERHAKALKIGKYAESKEIMKEQEEIQFEVAPEPTMDELIESIEDIVEQINARLDAIEARLPEVPAQESVLTTTTVTAQGLPVKPGTTATPALEEATKTIESLKAQIKVLEDQNKALKEEMERVKKAGESIILSTVTPPSDMISKTETIKKLKEAVYERAPQHWGYGPYEQNRRIKKLIQELESSK